MFGFGAGELVLVAVVLLLAVGPDRLPAFMRAVGKGVREFRKATRELRNSIALDELMRDEDLKNPFGDVGREMKGLGKEVTGTVSHVKDDVDRTLKTVDDVNRAMRTPGQPAARPPEPVAEERVTAGEPEESGTKPEDTET